MAMTTQYQLVGDELLIAIFHVFEKNIKLNFKDETHIMLAFYEASKKKEFSELFHNYHFDEDGVMPYSKEIADGINILHQSSLMGKMNPSFSYYTLSKGIDVRYQKFLDKKLNDNQKILLKELSEYIHQELIGNELVDANGDN